MTKRKCCFVVSFVKLCSTLIEISLHFSGSRDLDLLTYLMMIAKNRYMEFSRIGTFLHHALLSAMDWRHERQKRSIIKSLGNLFTIKGEDLLLLAMVMGLNDFRNLRFLQPYELLTKKVDLGGITKCFDELVLKADVDQIFDNVTTDIPFSMPSMCSNVSSYPKCRTYCEWQKNAFANIATSEIDVLERYGI